MGYINDIFSISYINSGTRKGQICYIFFNVHFDDGVTFDVGKFT